jgi:hypothetical protein
VVETGKGLWCAPMHLGHNTINIVLLVSSFPISTASNVHLSIDRERWANMHGAAWGDECDVVLLDRSISM